MNQPAINPFAVERDSIRHPAANPSRAATQFTVRDHRGNQFTFTGELIGSGTTRLDDHIHPATAYAPPRQPCSACRWFEAYVYLVAEPPANYPESGRYLAQTVGGSIVPGEVDFHRANFTDSGFEVVELLTIRKANRPPYMSTSAARALAQASTVDKAIREAYVNRAVA